MFGKPTQHDSKRRLEMPWVTLPQSVVCPLSLPRAHSERSKAVRLLAAYQCAECKLERKLSFAHFIWWARCKHMTGIIHVGTAHTASVHAASGCICGQQVLRHAAVPWREKSALRNGWSTRRYSGGAAGSGAAAPAQRSLGAAALHCAAPLLLRCRTCARQEWHINSDHSTVLDWQVDDCSREIISLQST